MGHQIYFYMTPEDAIVVQDQIKDLGPMKILHMRSPTQNPLVVDSLDRKEEGKQWLVLFLAREADLKGIVMHYVDVQDYWTVDALRSPVVEFTCSFFDGKILRRGRAYYVDGYHEQGKGWVEKDEQFKGWAKQILESIKKSLKRYMSDYIGPKAQSWLDAGGKLVTQ